MKSWLLKADLSSPEHQLARYIISNLNWGQSGEVQQIGRVLEDQCSKHCIVTLTRSPKAELRRAQPNGIGRVHMPPNGHE